MNVLLLVIELLWVMSVASSGHTETKFVSIPCNSYMSAGSLDHDTAEHSFYEFLKVVRSADDVC